MSIATRKGEQKIKHPGTLSSAEERAVRLKMLREMTGLSRDTFQERYGIARGTLQNWETARFGGLTPKGANVIISALQAEGVNCDLQWLLHGIGPEPGHTGMSGIIDKNHATGSIKIEPSEASTIAEELLAFRKNNPDAIDFVMQDNSMEPQFIIGHYVAGNRRFLQHIDEVVGQNCIVQSEEHGTMVRFVKPGDEIGHYHLIALNPLTYVRQPVLYNVRLLSAAPVVWSRRPNIAVERTS